MSNLKDIKPIVSIADDSLSYLLMVIAVLLIVAFFIRQIIKSRKKNDKQVAIEKLQKLDFSESKSVAYGFKKYAEVLCNSDNKAQFKQINNDLEKYKYKKYVDDLDPILIQQIKSFIHV